MIKKPFIIFIRFILLILQFSGLLLALILEYLAPKKMGVARYLVYKKDVFSATLFTPVLIQTYTIIIVASFIVCILLLKAKKGSMTVPLLFAAIYHAIGVLLLFTKDLYAYHFFAIGIFIVLVFQYGRLILLARKE